MADTGGQKLNANAKGWLRRWWSCDGCGRKKKDKSFEEWYSEVVVRGVDD